MSNSKDVAILAVGRVGQVLLLFLTYRVLTHVLPAVEVGLFLFLLSVTGYFGLVAVNPVGVYFNRKLHAWASTGLVNQRLAQFAGFAALVGVVAFLLIAGLVIAGAMPRTWDAGGGAIAAAVAFYVFSTTINNTFIPALNLLEYRAKFVVLTLVSQGLALLLSYVAVGRTPSAVVWLSASAVAQLLCGLIAWRWMRSEQVPQGESESLDFRELASFGPPLILTNFCMWALTQGYRPAVEWTQGLEALAIVGLGLGFASTLSVAFEYLVQQLYLPAFYKGIQSGDSEAKTRAWRTLWMASAPVYAALALFLTGVSPYLIRLLAAPEYSSAWIYLALGAWVELLRMYGNLVALASHMEMKTHSTIFAYVFGVIGAGFAWMVGASFAPSGVWVLPAALGFGHLLVFFMLRVRYAHLWILPVSRSWQWRPILFAIPFVGLLAVRRHVNDLSEVLVLLAVAGVAFAGTQFWLWKLDREAAA